MPQDRLAALRVGYRAGTIDRDDLAPAWHEQLNRWLAEAAEAGVVEPNAMVLATADPRTGPSSRTVLCKGLDPRGVAFYTNLDSAKSRELGAQARASATFPWYVQERQVHVRGRVEPVDRAETAAYWRSRPRGSQMGAWASPQSTPVPDRAALDAALAGTAERFADVADIPVPDRWGGWRIVPDRVEFWQGRPSRMHDRLVFERAGADAGWSVSRLAP